MIQALKDIRPDYANKLREMADLIEQTDKQPAAINLIVFWNDGEATIARKFEPGTQLMGMGGVMLRQAIEIVTFQDEQDLKT